MPKDLRRAQLSFNLSQTVKTTSSPATANATKGYYIQLGAYKDASSFNKETVIDIGVVESFQKGALTVFILTGYDTKAQTENALKKAKARGFKEAFMRLNN